MEKVLFPQCKKLPVLSPQEPKSKIEVADRSSTAMGHPYLEKAKLHVLRKNKIPLVRRQSLEDALKLEASKSKVWKLCSEIPVKILDMKGP